MENILSIIIIAIIAEALTETFLRLVKDRKFQWGYITALIVGQVVAFTTGYDIFKVLGVSVLIEGVGVVATGVLISRGSNFVSDLWGKINQAKIEYEPIYLDAMGEVEEGE